jgi:hypothetical protein
MNGWITPKLEYFECPALAQTLSTEALQSLLPRFLHVACPAEEQVIAAKLIDAGCVQVTSSGDQVVFRGRACHLRAAWEKCLEITGETHQLSFEIVTP